MPDIPEECELCGSDLIDDMEISILKCGEMFHSECLDRYIKKQKKHMPVM